MNDREICKLNQRYLRHNRPTDVLAFPLKEKGLWGEVFVSLDTARRQARELGHPFLQEIKILMIHGLLHLLGYDDKVPRERERMWRKTKRLLQKVGGV